MPTTYSGAVAMSATAGMNISTQALIPGPNTIPGNTTIPGSATYVTAVSNALLTGTAGLSDTATYVGRPTGALAGTAGLSVAAPAQTFVVAAGMSATAGLSAAALMTYQVGANIFTGVGALAAGGSSLQYAAVNFTPVSSLTASGLAFLPGGTIPTLAGVAALSTAATLTPKAQSVASLQGAASFGVTALRTTDAGGASFAGLSTLTDAPINIAAAAAALTGTSSLNLQLSYTGQVAATLVGVSTLSSAAVYIGVSSATLAGTASLADTAWAIYFIRSVPTLAATAGLSSAGHFELTGSFVLSASAALGQAFAVRLKVATVAMSAAAGLVADALVRSLIPPGFTPSPIATINTVPQWRLYIADTITGKIGYELPVISQSWTSKLNDIGSAQATINVDDSLESIAAWDERDPRVLFRQFLSGPLRYSGVFAYGDQAVWAGPLGPVSVPGDSPQIQIGFSEFAYMLTKRLLLGSRTDPTSQAGDLQFGPATPQQIMLDVITQAVGPGLAPYGLPAYLANPLPSGGRNDKVRVYYGFDFSTVWDGVRSLSAERDGPDVRFDPKLTYKSDGLYLSYDIQIGSPMIYSDRTWAWDVPSNASIAWNTNMQNFATTYWGEGAGQDRTKLVATASNPSLYDLGFPAIEMADSLHSSVDDPYQLQALVDGDMLMYQQPSVKWTVKVQGDQDPQTGSFRVGDIFTVTVRDHPAVPDGTYRRRITELSGDQTEWVSVSSADAYVVQTTTQEGVQVITNA